MSTNSFDEHDRAIVDIDANIGAAIDANIATLRAFGETMPWGGILAVGAGAAVGAWVRWILSILLNPLFPLLPLGTLTANLVGGLLMGFAMEFLSRETQLPPEVRLLLTTGLLGGLTTFSSFSAEVVTQLARKEYLWGSLTIAAHVIGSIAMTLIGVLVVRAFYAWGSPA